MFAQDLRTQPTKADDETAHSFWKTPVPLPTINQRGVEATHPGVIDASTPYCSQVNHPAPNNFGPRKWAFGNQIPPPNINQPAWPMVVRHFRILERLSNRATMGRCVAPVPESRCPSLNAAGGWGTLPRHSEVEGVGRGWIAPADRCMSLR